MCSLTNGHEDGALRFQQIRLHPVDVELCEHILRNAGAALAREYKYDVAAIR